MCLSYPPNGLSYSDMANRYIAWKAGNAAREALAAHGPSVSCDNSLTCVSRTKTGGLSVLTSIPVTGTETVVFPIAPEHAEKLLPCAAFDCQASKLHGITHPSTYVPYVEDVVYTGPVYRSLSASASAPTAPPAPQLKKMKIFANPDGGYVAVLPVSPFLSGDQVTPEQRERLGVPMLKCIEDGLTEAKIPPKRVFGPDYDPEEDGSKFGLLAFLFEACVRGCNIVIGVMPEGKTEGRFTFLYHDPTPLPNAAVPMLGLAHGDRAPVTRMHDTYYVVCNDDSLRLRLEASDPLPDERRKASDVVIIPQPVQNYCHDYYKKDPATAMGNPDDDLTGIGQYAHTNPHLGGQPVQPVQPVQPGQSAAPAAEHPEHPEDQEDHPLGLPDASANLAALAALAPPDDDDEEEEGDDLYGGGDWGRGSYHRTSYKGPRGVHTHGNLRWLDAQRAFQQPLVQQLFQAMTDFFVANKCEPMDSVQQMCVSDIKGLPIPRDTVQAVIDVDPLRMNSPYGMKRLRLQMDCAARVAKATRSANSAKAPNTAAAESAGAPAPEPAAAMEVH